MRTIAITGAASGIGAATSERLQSEGHRVIGVDLHETDIAADLATPQGRSDAIDECFVVHQTGMPQPMGASLAGKAAEY